MGKRLAAFAIAIIMTLLTVPAHALTAYANVDTFEPLSAPGTFNVDDIAAINSMIDNNGLNWPKAPEDGSSIPDEWLPPMPNTVWSDAETSRRLTGLTVTWHNLTGTLDLTGLPYLTQVILNENNLSGFNAYGLDNLTWITLNNNRNLGTLDLSGLPGLTTLHVFNAGLTQLLIPDSPNLATISANGNRLTALDLTSVNAPNQWVPSLNGIGQTVNLELTGSGTNFTLEISLNNPTFGDANITYENGILRSNNNTISSTTFTVETGIPGRTLSGTINFTYTQSAVCDYCGEEDCICDTFEFAPGIVVTGHPGSRVYTVDTAVASAHDRISAIAALEDGDRVTFGQRAGRNILEAAKVNGNVTIEVWPGINQTAAGGELAVAFYSLMPGDTLIFHEGNYGRMPTLWPGQAQHRAGLPASFVLPNPTMGGTEGNLITIRGYENGARPRISLDAPGNPTAGPLFSLNASFIDIAYLEFGRSGGAHAIRLSSVSGTPANLVVIQQITVRDSVFNGAGNDVSIAANWNWNRLDGLFIENNVFLNYGNSPIYIGVQGGQFWGTNVEIRNNISDGRHLSRVDMTTGYFAQFKVNVSGIVENNIILNSRGPGVMIYGVDPRDFGIASMSNADEIRTSIVRNNIVAGAYNILGDYWERPHHSWTHNYLFMYDWYWFGGPGLYAIGGITEVYNNIALGNGAGGIMFEDYWARGSQAAAGRSPIIFRDMAFRNNTSANNLSFFRDYEANERGEFIPGTDIPWPDTPHPRPLPDNTSNPELNIVVEDNNFFASDETSAKLHGLTAILRELLVVNPSSMPDTAEAFFDAIMTTPGPYTEAELIAKLEILLSGHTNTELAAAAVGAVHFTPVHWPPVSQPFYRTSQDTVAAALAQMQDKVNAVVNGLAVTAVVAWQDAPVVTTAGLAAANYLFDVRITGETVADVTTNANIVFTAGDCCEEYPDCDCDDDVPPPLPVVWRGNWSVPPIQPIDYALGDVVPDESGIIVWQTDLTVGQKAGVTNNNISIFLSPQGFTGTGPSWWVQVGPNFAPVSLNYNAANGAWGVMNEAGQRVQLWNNYRMEEGNTYRIYIIINAFTHEVEFELWEDGERLRDGAIIMPPNHRDLFEDGLARVTAFIQGTFDVIYTLTNYTQTWPGRVVGVDKSALIALIEYAETLVESDWTVRSWTIFAEALADAITVRDNDNAVQRDVFNAITALQAAIDGLVSALADCEECGYNPNDCICCVDCEKAVCECIFCDVCGYSVYPVDRCTCPLPTFVGPNWAQAGNYRTFGGGWTNHQMRYAHDTIMPDEQGILRWRTDITQLARGSTDTLFSFWIRDMTPLGTFQHIASTAVDGPQNCGTPILFWKTEAGATDNWVIYNEHDQRVTLWAPYRMELGVAYNLSVEINVVTHEVLYQLSRDGSVVREATHVMRAAHTHNRGMLAYGLGAVQITLRAGSGPAYAISNFTRVSGGGYVLPLCDDCTLHIIHCICVWCYDCGTFKDMTRATRYRCDCIPLCCDDHYNCDCSIPVCCDDMGNCDHRMLVVGPGRQFATPQAAHNAAQPGDIIMIDAEGTYFGAAALLTITVPNLTIRGFNGRPAMELPYQNFHFENRNDPQSRHQQTRAIMGNRTAMWIVESRGVVIENIELFGAATNTNAANPAMGISVINNIFGSVTVRDIHIHRCEMAFHVNAWNTDIVIERSEFSHSGERGPEAFVSMINLRARNVEISHSYFHSLRQSESVDPTARTGTHIIASRTSQFVMRYSRLGDVTPCTYRESFGHARTIRFYEQGDIYLIGNVFYSKYGGRGAPSGHSGSGIRPIDIGQQNAAALAGDRGHGRRLFVINNTFMSDNTINNVPIDLYNPLWGTDPRIEEPQILVANNIFGRDPSQLHLRNFHTMARYVGSNVFTGRPGQCPDIFYDRYYGRDPRIIDTPESRALVIGQGIDPNVIAAQHGFTHAIDICLIPRYVFTAEVGATMRRPLTGGVLDIGAYQFVTGDVDCGYCYDFGCIICQPELYCATCGERFGEWDACSCNRVIYGYWTRHHINYAPGDIVPDQDGTIVWSTDINLVRRSGGPDANDNSHLTLYMRPQGQPANYPWYTQWAAVTGPPIAIEHRQTTNAWVVRNETGASVTLWPAFRMTEGVDYQVVVTIDTDTFAVTYELWEGDYRHRVATHTMPPAHRDAFADGLASATFVLTGDRPQPSVYRISNWTLTFPEAADPPNLITLTVPTDVTLSQAVANYEAVIALLPDMVNVTTTDATTSLPINWSFTGIFNTAPGAQNTFAWTAELGGILPNGVTTYGTIVVTNYTATQLPIFGWSIFNNGPGGTQHPRPNAGLAANGTIRMWTQLDGTNAPVYLAASDTIVALDQDGECAMEFVRANRMWVAGIGWADYFSMVDVNKNGQWQYISLYITVYGQTVHVLLANALFEPPAENATVTFIVEVGAVGVYVNTTTTVDVPVGEAIPAGAIPSTYARTGFYFVGWYPTNPTGFVVHDNITFTAIFAEDIPVEPRIISVTPSPAVVERGGVVEIIVTTQGMPDGAWIDLNVWRTDLSVVGGPRFYIVDNQATITISAADNARLGQDGFSVTARVAGDWGSVIMIDSYMFIIAVQ